MAMARSSDSRRTAVLHEKEPRRSRDRRAAPGDELPASPRSDTALHDRANSFQAAGEGGGKEGGGQGNVSGRK